jgi:hypothetical protein
VDHNLGSVLVPKDAQFEGVARVYAACVSNDGSCVHSYMVIVVWVEECLALYSLPFINA